MVHITVTDRVDPATTCPHAQSPADVAATLGVTPERGLAADEVARRRERFGPNELQLTRAPTFLELVLRQLKSLLIAILLAAAAISVLIGEPRDAGVILAIVILNALIGAIQEARAGRALAALREMGAPMARVLRDGVVHNVPAAALVPGDVVHIRAGDVVPADGRLLSAVALEVDESALTGESLPIEKRAEVTLAPETALPDRVNLAYAGTAVTYGHGELLVTATGPTTELGRLAEAVAGATPQPTPLERQIAWLGKVLSVLALGASAVVFALGLLRGLPPAEMFLVAVSLAVAAVPEGLPAVVTIVLALGVQRMARRNAIVRRLASVEALGAATVICTDKTGTLTLGEMRVAGLLADDRWLELRDGAPRVDGRVVDPDRDPVLVELLRAAVLANNARLGPTPLGDPTERALLHLAHDLDVDRAALEATYPRIGEVPFSSDRKRMATVHTSVDGMVAYVKGAPDLILPHCNAVMRREGPRPLGPADLAGLQAAIQERAGQGLRLLALACRRLEQAPAAAELAEQAAAVETDLTLLGIVGLVDPLRPEVPAALAACRAASIRVVMITGDHPATATAIARELGFADGQVVTGAELEQMTADDLDLSVAATPIYARVAPRQKQEIVRALQRSGEVVAMTGDGANDAPALKLADIGVAMGIRGTAVAREAAAIVLTDDNFASIVAAIEEGRTIYANLRKAVLYLLSGNLGEILVLVLAMLVGLPLPLQPIMILWINLLTDALPAVGLSMEPREPGLMRRPPRLPGERFLPGWTIPLIGVPSGLLALTTLTAFVAALAREPDNLAAAQTAAFVTLVLAHLGISWAMRTTHGSSLSLSILANPTLLLASLGGAALLLVVVYTELGQALFHTHPLDLAAWVIALTLAPLPFLGTEAVKLILTRRADLSETPASPAPTSRG